MPHVVVLQVNEVTPELFTLAPDAAAMAAQEVATVQKIIQPIGLAPTKAKNLVNMSQVSSCCQCSGLSLQSIIICRCHSCTGHQWPGWAGSWLRRTLVTQVPAVLHQSRCHTCTCHQWPGWAGSWLCRTLVTQVPAVLHQSSRVHICRCCWERCCTVQLPCMPLTMPAVLHGTAAPSWL
jgi:hypothetical protein